MEWVGMGIEMELSIRTCQTSAAVLKLAGHKK